MTSRTVKPAEAAAQVSAAFGSVENAVKMSDEEFARAAALVHKLSGIVIKDHKREMMQSRLSRRLRALNFRDFKSYLDFVASDAGREELGELVNAVTTNLTSFFRESHHFDHLRSEILDPMMQSGASRIRIWSSACSSGEEPYSIAMTALGSKAATARDLKILATDLDTNMLARGREGVYPLDRFQPAPKDVVARATMPAGADSLRFKPEARGLITFNQLNLFHAWPFKGPFDAIFCRNVLIYFELDAKKSLVDRMAKLIRPGGALYLGHSESLLGDHPLLASEGRTIYRRKP